MKIILHGTGAGHPSASRGASATSLLFSDGNSILIDAGEGCSRAMLRDEVPLNNVTHVVISHTHADHWTGLPNLVMGWILNQRVEPATLILPPGSLDFFAYVLRQSWLLESRRPFELAMKQMGPIELPDQWRLRPFRTSHLDRHADEASQISIPFPSFGFVVESGEGKILFSQDIASEVDLGAELSGTDILICESAHVDLSQVLISAERASISRVIFTHIPPYREDDFQHLEHQGPVEWLCAEDGTTISL
ncbi:MAG: MBL fold metallo-hydrolase [Chlorobi bacterium]|nr:MBL fold metallo-hydrolase [Chlorobiota bacterium]